MQTALLALHNLTRWIVVAAGIWAFFRAWRGWTTRAIWTDTDHKAGKYFVLAITIQFVVGFALYAASPLIQQGLSDMGAAMRDPNLRKMVVEHPIMMLLSVALVHIGAGRVKKATSDSGRFQAATIWWGIAIASVLGFIPWNRPILPF